MGSIVHGLAFRSTELNIPGARSKYSLAPGRKDCRQGLAGVAERSKKAIYSQDYIKHSLKEMTCSKM